MKEKENEALRKMCKSYEVSYAAAAKHAVGAGSRVLTSISGGGVSSTSSSSNGDGSKGEVKQSVKENSEAGKKKNG